MPLDVDKGIELPQLELMSTKSDDCTTVYSTGSKDESSKTIKLSLKILSFLRKVHLPRSCFQIQTSSWLLSFPHLCSHMSYCYHVMDIILDKA